MLLLRTSLLVCVGVPLYPYGDHLIVRVTPIGLISLVKKALMSSHEKGYTQRAVLCYDRTVHIYHELWDSGWGCGYVIPSTKYWKRSEDTPPDTGIS